MPDGISGFIKEQDAGKVYICINKLDNAYRKRFTIAHELGHYFRHRDKIKGGFIDGISKNAIDGARIDMMTRVDDWSKQEMEANEFAAEILMPKVLFQDTYNRFNGDVLQISEYFLVSRAACLTRMKKLKLLSGDLIDYLC